MLPPRFLLFRPSPVLASLFSLLLLGVSTGLAAPAFPGAAGYGSETPGGRGGRIIKVTNLDAAGPGSLAAAVAAKGPRIVVFEVGGVIDLGGNVLKIAEPFLTI